MKHGIFDYNVVNVAELCLFITKKIDMFIGGIQGQKKRQKTKEKRDLNIVIERGCGVVSALFDPLLTCLSMCYCYLPIDQHWTDSNRCIL